MNDQEQQALIADCEAEIEQIKQSLKTWGGVWIPYLQSRLKRQEIALAALTAEPVGYFRVGPDGIHYPLSKSTATMDMKPLYAIAAPPASVKLPSVTHPAQFDYADKVAEVLKANGLKVVGYEDE